MNARANFIARNYHRGEYGNAGRTANFSDPREYTGCPIRGCQGHAYGDEFFVDKHVRSTEGSLCPRIQTRIHLHQAFSPLGVHCARGTKARVGQPV